MDERREVGCGGMTHPSIARARELVSDQHRSAHEARYAQWREERADAIEDAECKKLLARSEEARRAREAVEQMVVQDDEQATPRRCATWKGSRAFRRA